MKVLFMFFFCLYMYTRDPFACLAFGFILLFLGLTWRIARRWYVQATFKGLHYVHHTPQEYRMNIAVRNPFHVEVDLARANFHSVRCAVKCDGVCFMQALYGVPIYDLVEYLHGDWDTMRYEFFLGPMEFFDKCVIGSTPFILLHDPNSVHEFSIPSHINPADLHDNSREFSRVIYPFVLLLVLSRPPDRSKYPGPHVVVSATAVHMTEFPHHRSYIITEFVKISSGQVGQIKNVYLSSPDDEDSIPDQCLICCQRRATVVQMSCRHLCLCKECFLKCDSCPVCRNPYRDYFEMPFYSGVPLYKRSRTFRSSP